MERDEGDLNRKSFSTGRALVRLGGVKRTEGDEKRVQKRQMAYFLKKMQSRR